ncbi:MAG: ATP-binding protein [Lentisphaerae bacterium]|nr:ATP-binding protein [Lentisphaerota bacterium]
MVVKIVSGSMKGTEFPVKAPAISIGRASEADFQVHDTLISRVHCRLTCDGGNWYVEDLNSTNGTWMVGQKVNNRVLLPLRTSVRIGNTIFELYNLYAARDETQSFSIPFVSYRIQPETLASSIGLEKRPAPVQVDPMRIAREENKRLSAIYKFQNLIAAIFNEAELCPRILSAIGTIINSDRSYLLVYNLTTGAFEPVAARAKDAPMSPIAPSAIRKVIVDFVKENREAVLSSDSMAERLRVKVAGAPTVSDCTMCVPMLGKQQLNGMIYLNISGAKEPYTEDDLKLLTVIGHTAGMALENSRLIDFNLRNERLVATGTTAAHLSHYIKNILAGLDGSLNLLRMGIDEKDFGLANESLHILAKNHRRLGNLVLDLLNLTSEQKLNMKIQEIKPIIDDINELLAPQLKQDGITLAVTQSSMQLPLFAEIDAKGIHRVLLNLILNAEHAVQEKRETLDQQDMGNITVDASFTLDRESIVFTVTDDGMGLKPESIDKIFDLFVSSKGAGGTGLGLTVSKRIIEGHGGTIFATSEEGKGCVMTFTIPVSHNETSTSTRAISRNIFKSA